MQYIKIWIKSAEIHEAYRKNEGISTNHLLALHLHFQPTSWHRPPGNINVLYISSWCTYAKSFWKKSHESYFTKFIRLTFHLKCLFCQILYYYTYNICRKWRWVVIGAWINCPRFFKVCKVLTPTKLLLSHSAVKYFWSFIVSYFYWRKLTFFNK